MKFWFEVLKERRIIMASYRELKPNKNGKPRIEITVELGYDDKGKRIRKYKTVTLNNLTERAIKKAITEMEIQVANESTISLEKITFAQFTERWMNMYVKVDLTVKSRNSYESYLKNGILESLGSLQMDKIKTFHIVQFFTKQKKENKKSLSGKCMVLKSIFSTAVKWQVIETNPMNGVERPSRSKRYKEIEFYDEEQLKLLLKKTKEMYPKHALQIKLAALAGLRMSEIAGIRHECLNFVNNTILIDSTLQYDKEDKNFFLGPTKTKRPRTVNVPAELMREIKQYVKDHKKLQLASGEAWKPMKDDKGTPINLLFTKTNGFPSHPDSMSGRWREIVERHNLPKLTFHGLRHTYASFMVSKNVNFKIIQEQLGHVNIQETVNTYSHLTIKDKEKATDFFDSIL